MAPTLSGQPVVWRRARLAVTARVTLTTGHKALYFELAKSGRGAALQQDSLTRCARFRQMNELKTASFPFIAENLEQDSLRIDK